MSKDTKLTIETEDGKKVETSINGLEKVAELSKNIVKFEPKGKSD